MEMDQTATLHSNPVYKQGVIQRKKHTLSGISFFFFFLQVGICTATTNRLHHFYSQNTLMEDNAKL